MSLRSIKSGATAITEASVLQFITDLLKASGILDTTGTQFQVTGSGTNLSVNVAIGRAYLLASGGNGYPIINDAVVNVSINPNSSGNPRYTAIVLYKNLSLTPNADDTNTTFVIAVDGTAAPSPSYPNASTIQSAVGSSNPYTVLAYVLVASGATIINNGNITDARQQVAFRSDILNQDAWVTPTVNVGGTTTLDLSKGKKFQITMGAGNTTLALLNVPLNCKTIEVRITQDSSGGRTVTWFGGISWPNGVVPTLSTGANKSDSFGINFLTVTNDTTNTSEGSVIGQNI